MGRSPPPELDVRVEEIEASPCALDAREPPFEPLYRIGVAYGRDEQRGARGVVEVDGLPRDAGGGGDVGDADALPAALL